MKGHVFHSFVLLVGGLAVESGPCAQCELPSGAPEARRPRWASRINGSGAQGAAGWSAGAAGCAFSTNKSTCLLDKWSGSINAPETRSCIDRLTKTLENMTRGLQEPNNHAFPWGHRVGPPRSCVCGDFKDRNCWEEELTATPPGHRQSPHTPSTAFSFRHMQWADVDRGEEKIKQKCEKT